MRRPAWKYRPPSCPRRERKRPRRRSPCAAMAAAELSTGSSSLKGSAGGGGPTPAGGGGPGTPRVPGGEAVGGGRALEVVVGGRARRFEHEALDDGAPADDCEIAIVEHGHELELLREAEHRPGEPARPRAERRVALLAVRPAVAAVGHVEDRFVGHAAPHVVVVAPPAVVDVVLGGSAGVLHEPLEEAHLRVRF